MSAAEGGCLCGRVRFRLSAEALDSGYCHCRMCQLNSGAPVVAWTTFPTAAFAWTAAEPKIFASSSHGRRMFCAECGSYLIFTSLDSPDEVSVNTASFDDPAAFPPRRHIYTASRIAWFETADALPRHAEGGSAVEYASLFHPTIDL